MGHPMGPPTPQHPTVTHKRPHSTIGPNAPPPRAVPQHPMEPLWVTPCGPPPHSAPQMHPLSPMSGPIASMGLSLPAPAATHHPHART